MSQNDFIILGNVQILLHIESLNRSSISRLNSLISSQFCLYISLSLYEISPLCLLRLLRRESSSEEQCSRHDKSSSLSLNLNYYIQLHISTLNYDPKNDLIKRQALKELIKLTHTIVFILLLYSKKISMQNTPYYINKQFIPKINEEEVIQNYSDVEVYIDEMKIIGMKLQITTHRLIFTSNSHNALLIKGQSISDVGISQSGFFSKDYFVKLHTQYGKIKFALKSYNQAKLNVENMVKKKAWLIKPVQKKPESQMYSGLFQKINKEKEKITTQNEQVSQSFASFDSLFGNLREIKKIMNDMKASSGQSDGDNPQIHKILKDMGFVSVIEKDESGDNFYKELAQDLYQVCVNSLFKNYGGVVSLVDLYYFYNKKRQLNLLSPEEIVKACQLFHRLGLHAKLVRYPNNLILIQSTTFDADADFKQNYAKYFTDFKEGFTAEQIARRKGLPVSIADIKLKQACKKGWLAYSDRIEGIKYYKNLLMTI